MKNYEDMIRMAQEALDDLMSGKKSAEECNATVDFTKAQHAVAKTELQNNIDQGIHSKTEFFEGN